MDERAKWPDSVWQGIKDVAELTEIGQVILVTSTLIRPEIFMGRLSTQQKQNFSDLLRRKNVQEVAPHIRIADRASAIREKHNVLGNRIKTPDAIHLATAIIYEVDEMHTMDGYHDDGHRDGLLALSGNVADYKLLITMPFPRGSHSEPNNSSVSAPLKGDQDSFSWNEIVEDNMESHEDEQDGTEEGH
jgi:predicted nucleic acid-binding protein